MSGVFYEPRRIGLTSTTAHARCIIEEHQAAHLKERCHPANGKRPIGGWPLKAHVFAGAPRKPYGDKFPIYYLCKQCGIVAWIGRPCIMEEPPR
jgi:hypothetical protein